MSINPAECAALAQDLYEIDRYPVQELNSSQDYAKIISLSSLALSNFRNYEYARIEVSPAPVVLTGENGAGKTNILEAISLLSVGRGLRRAKLAEIDKLYPHSNPLPKGEGVIEPSPFGRGQGEGQYWAISANVLGRNGKVQIGTGRSSDAPLQTSPLMGEDNKRIVKIDGKITRGQAELAKHISLIWLTPQMEQLFTEGASAGRKFLDRLVFSFEAEHATHINEYEYAMRERNKLLQYGRADAVWLAALEQKMAGCAAVIAAARLATCEHVNHTIAASPLSFPKAYVDVSGFVEDLLKNGLSALEAENNLRMVLESSRNQDAAAGRTLTGVHRSELKVTHLGKNMQAENCSMGEQKAMMLSIVLAQARAGARWHGVTPIILLDEVAGHLDATKRMELFEEISDIGAQVWMTGTDLQSFEGLQGKAQFFTVENNSVKS